MDRVFAGFLAAALSFSGPAICAQASGPDSEAVVAVMQKSADDWNRGDLDAFAASYKNSPDILFIGRTTRRGYAEMLATYKAGYPTAESRGTLTFNDLAVQPLDAHFATVTGKFHLARTAAGGGNANGHFLLVLEKTPEGWRIIRDDTSDDTPAIAGSTRAGQNNSGPPPCPAEAHQFDFWQGEWYVTGPKGAHVGDSSVHAILDNCVILENWVGTRGGSGKSFNTFDPAEKKWRQYWVDNGGNHTQFTNGVFTAPSLVFEGHNARPTGPATQRFTFTKLDDNNVRQMQEDSVDGGQTWTTTYDFHYTRKPGTK